MTTFDREYGFDPNHGYNPKTMLDRLSIARRILLGYGDVMNQHAAQEFADMGITTGKMIEAISLVMGCLESELKPCEYCGEVGCNGECDNNYENWSS